MRGDLFSTFALGGGSNSTAALSFDPRLAARVKVSDHATMLSAFGITHQEPSFILPIPGLSPSTNLGRLQTAVQTSLGVETHLPYEITATATGFLQDFLDMTDPTATCIDNALGSANVSCNDERGARTRLRSRALRAKAAHQAHHRLALVHALALDPPGALALRPRRDHRCPQRVRPAPTSSARSAPSISAAGGALARRSSPTPARRTRRREFGVPVAPYNSQRLPAFYRIDVRIEKSWPLGKKGHIAVVLEGLNITLQQEATEAECVSTTTPMPGVLDRCTPALHRADLDPEPRRGGISLRRTILSAMRREVRHRAL